MVILLLHIYTEYFQDSPYSAMCSAIHCNTSYYRAIRSYWYSAIKKNSFESVLMRWMKLEPIIQSEVSQKDKEHYSILTHICGI